MFAHIVFFKFKDPMDALEARRRLEGMRGQVASLRRIEVGIDELGTGRSWHMVLDTRFDHQEGYRAYASDPTHLKVLQWLKTVVQESATVDYTLDDA